MDCYGNHGLHIGIPYDLGKIALEDVVGIPFQWNKHHLDAQIF
jgi:hypothetical protein